MGENIFDKIIEKHIIDGKMENLTEIGLKIDQTLTQDATGTMASLQFETLGFSEVKTELSVSYIDHNTIQVGFENFDDHKYLKSVASKYGIIYSRAGNGICHQVHLERFARPGKTLLGSDSHTPTAGGIGSMAMGAGGLDVAVAMGGGPFYITYPKVIKVNLKGKLKPWVSAKDIVLKVLKALTTKGNVGCALEFGGEGVKNLTVPERATITNMGAETGVTTSIFPSDEVTKEFMIAEGREDQWIELKADPDAEYEREIEIDLSELEPMVACPHSPGNVKKVKNVEGIKVDQVVIGSCTNSSFRDLSIVAEILKGKITHKAIEFGIAPGSRQVLEMIAKSGALESLVKSGARILESACGFCIGNSFAPGTNSVSLRTSNRNFLGRSGTKSAQLFLASPETAAASVITGKITDPRDLESMGIKYPEIKLPKKFFIDDSMFIFPSQGEKEEIFRGPNIKSAPKNTPLPSVIKGEVMLKVGDLITTDHIMPAGARLKYRSNVPKYAEFVFENVDSTFPERCLANKQEDIHNIIVAGLSYGQGSSREHAALCPMYLGVKAVIAKSIERIHHANLLNFGILPLVFKNEEDYNKIEQGDTLEMPNIIEELKAGKDITVKNLTKNREFTIKYALSTRQKDVILSGGLLPYTAKRR
ncbi:MAG: aconitate hydratase [candidate division WOR-3 bacterium]|nr:aconitate hydratase [candidate division WOR-3 bacterium]